MFCVTIKDKYVRVGSYQSYTLVEVPSKATLYSRKADAVRRYKGYRDDIARGYKKDLEKSDLKIVEITFIDWEEKEVDL